MKTPTSPAGSEGFTLLELLLALVILGLTMAVALPELGGWRDDWALREAAFRARLHLGQARLRAIEEGRVVLVSQAERGAALWIDGAAVELGGAARRVSVAPAQATPGRRPALRFYPDGGADAGVIWLDSGRRRLGLALEPASGRVLLAGR